MGNGRVYKVKYQILTPIHIGTGEDLTPFDYVIENRTFHRVIADEIISSLNQEQLNKFYAFIDRNDITGLRKLIAENFDREKFSKYEVNVTSTVAEEYQRKLGNVNNQLLISPFIRSGGDFKPYIPGSSIKGAIRTAVIERVAKDKTEVIDQILKSESYKSNTWEQLLLGAVRMSKGGERKVDISKDPFRALKIADVFVSDEIMEIGKVFNVKVNERRNRLEKIDIQMIKEVVKGQIVIGKPVEFEGEIIIDEFLPKFRAISLSSSLTKEFIIEACNSFYSEEFRREQEFYEFAVDMGDIINSMRNLLRVGSNECLIRVGRFSGVYAVTINKRKPHNRKWGTTRNLFEGKYPMGWMKIKFIG